MAVKIITQRTVTPDRQPELQLLLRQLRMKAINQPGYLMGMVDIDKTFIESIRKAMPLCVYHNDVVLTGQVFGDRCPAQPIIGGPVQQNKR